MAAGRRRLPCAACGVECVACIMHAFGYRWLACIWIPAVGYRPPASPVYVLVVANSYLVRSKVRGEQRRTPHIQLHAPKRCPFPWRAVRGGSLASRAAAPSLPMGKAQRKAPLSAKQKMELPPLHHLMGIVAVLLGMVMLQREIAGLTQLQRDEISLLRNEVSELKGGIADMLVGSSTLSAEQLAQLLALRKESSAQASCSDGGDSDSAPQEEEQEEGWFYSILSICFIIGLLIPPAALAKYEFEMGSKKAHQPDFTWSEQIQYRLDYWLSNYDNAKPLALLMLTGVLTSIGTIIYFPVELWGFGSADAGTTSLPVALWMSWCFVSDPGTLGDQEGALGRVVAFAVTVGGMLVFALMVSATAAAAGFISPSPMPESSASHVRVSAPSLSCSLLLCVGMGPSAADITVIHYRWGS